VWGGRGAKKTDSQSALADIPKSTPDSAGGFIIL